MVGLEVWVSAAALDWWAGASFGPRRLTSMVPLLAVGLANLLANVLGGQPVVVRRRRLVVAAAMAVFAAWAVLTTFLFTGDVRDLGPLLWGESAGMDEIATGVPPVDRARSLARLAELPRAADHLAGHLAHTGAAWFEPAHLPTFVAAVGLLALAIWSARRLPRRPALAVALGGVLLLAVGAQARLLTGAAPPSDAELATWRSRVRAFQVEESTAPPPPAANAPTSSDTRWRDAHLVLSAYTDLRRGESARAQASLGELAAHHYPIVDAALAVFHRADATGHELVGWEPGRWFDPAREARNKPRVFTVPSGPLRVSFALAGPWGKFARPYRLARLSSPAIGTADLVVDAATLRLEATGQVASAPLPPTPCPFELRLDADGRLQARCGASELAVQLAPPNQSPAAEPLYLAFGQQLRGGKASAAEAHPMTGRAFADLVVTRRRPGG